MFIVICPMNKVGGLVLGLGVIGHLVVYFRHKEDGGS